MNGIVKKGVLNSSVIKKLLQIVWFRFGSQPTIDLIDDHQKEVLAYLLIVGYTVGMKDIILPDKANESIRDIIETKRKIVMHQITEYENDPTTISKFAFETYLKEYLKAVQGDIQDVVMNNIDKTGGVYKCISSESAGTTLNGGQIMGAVGQVIVEDERIGHAYNGRSLPMFFQGDNSPLARGFCPSSFSKRECRLQNLSIRQWLVAKVPSIRLLKQQKLGICSVN